MGYMYAERFEESDWESLWEYVVIAHPACPHAVAADPKLDINQPLGEQPAATQQQSLRAAA